MTRYNLSDLMLVLGSENKNHGIIFDKFALMEHVMQFKKANRFQRRMLCGCKILIIKSYQ